MAGRLSSFWTYRGELRSGRREIALLAIPSFLGGIVGAVLLLRTDNATFAAIVPYLVLRPPACSPPNAPWRWQSRRAMAAAQLPAETAAAGPHDQRTAAGRWIAVLAFQFLVGLYGGYFGAGIGILMLAALGYLGFTNIHHMNALKNLNAMCINGIAAVLFVAKGLVDWRCGLLMAAGESWVASPALVGCAA